MLRKYLLLIFSVFTLLSCQPKVKKDAFHVIDSQLNSINSIIQRYRKLPVDSLQLVLETKLYPKANKIRNNILVFENLSESDQQILYSYVEYVNNLEDILKLANKTLDGIGMARVQFMALKKDIQNDKIPMDSIMQYVEFEVENFSIIQIDVQKVLMLETIPQNARILEKQTDSIVESVLSKISPSTK